jgi:ATP-dependent Clp protease ATP-binding subunit ClpC
MTSNLGSRQLKDFAGGVGFSTPSKAADSDKNNKIVIETALKRFFSPEFLNRIDDVIVFSSLEKNSIIKILDLTLEKLLKRIEDLGFKVKVTDAAKEFLADKGFDPDMGARPLARTIQKFMEDPIAEELLKMEMNEGDTIEIDYDKEANTGELKISSSGKKAPRKKKDTPPAEKPE